MLRRIALTSVMCLGGWNASYAEGWVQNQHCPSCLDFMDSGGKLHAINEPNADFKGGPSAFSGESGADMRSGSYRCRQLATSQENARLAGMDTLRRMEANNYRLECQ